MSFIDKALERAKALHQRREKVGVPPEGGMKLRPEVPLSQAPGTLGYHLPAEEITYRVTRTAAVDAETMRRHRLIVGNDSMNSAEEYKLLRTHILQRTKGEGFNTFLVTGPLPGEGKTLTAINLAISISQDVTQTVLLVDADLRSPSVHRYFGLPSGPGLVNHLTDGVPLSELLIHPQGLDKLVLLPGGRPVSQSSELISSPLMADLVQELKHFYPDRYVIFDVPPLLSYADTLAFAPLVDGIIVVVEAGKTPREEIGRCLEMLKKFPVLGLVLNKVEASPRSYYYYGKEGPRPRKGKKFPWFK